MAEQQNPEEQAAPAKKRLPIKTLIIVAVVLVMEVATVVVVLLIGPKPAPVKAEPVVTPETIAEETLIEELIVEEKFSNLKTGQTLIYDMEIWVTVKQKHHEQVAASIESMKARITTDIAAIVSRAQPAHFAEAALVTLTRQIRDAVDQRVGLDPVEEVSRIDEVFIKRCMPFKADQ
ncbi:MAG: hypothetical protein CMJ18_20800 [Phycisphaeraceae bacterium]|nr:hypothetical protein [Phycisphaeraceae bacterium]